MNRQSVCHKKCVIGTIHHDWCFDADGNRKERRDPKREDRRDWQMAGRVKRGDVPESPDERHSERREAGKEQCAKLLNEYGVMCERPVGHEPPCGLSPANHKGCICGSNAAPPEYHSKACPSRALFANTKPPKPEDEARRIRVYSQAETAAHSVPITSPASVVHTVEAAKEKPLTFARFLRVAAETCEWLERNGIHTVDDLKKRIVQFHKEIMESVARREP